ncbi:MAG: glycan-binding surface protein [Mangrovibacterium sp.]
MKTINKLSWSLLAVLFLVVGFTSCDDEESYSGAISISKVYLEDATSEVVDREVEFARLGQIIRLEGSGFSDLRKVYINGYDTYFNPVMTTDGSMVLRVSYDTPLVEATDDVRNTIRLVNDGNSLNYEFTIRAALPNISSISHTMPAVGELITVYGSGLTDIESVTFPGDIVVTEGITSDEDGAFFTIAMPEGVAAEGGSIFASGSNGGAYSAAYFNCKSNVILDFDGTGSQGYWGWSETGSMLDKTDLGTAALGEGNLSQGNYVNHHPERKGTFPAAKNRNTEVWTAGNGVDDWRGQLTEAIPASTLVSQVAFQFDMYVDGIWTNTGFLKIALINNFNGGEWTSTCYNYVPWIEGGKVVEYENAGWVTVTVPFSQFYSYAKDAGTDEEATFEKVLAARENASYKNFGMYFENSDFTLDKVTGSTADAETEMTSAETDVKVYTDNWRVVSLAKPTYSDFPTE